MKWDWIFFDADETLFTFDSFGGLQRMFLDYSVTFTAEDFQDYQAVNKPLWVDYQNGAITALQLQHQRFDSWAERLNVPPGTERRVYECDGGDLCAAAGAVSLLNAAGQGQNGHHHQRFYRAAADRLERTGLRDHFDLLVISEEVGVAKPDPRIFDYALAQAGNPTALAGADGRRYRRVGYSRRHERRSVDLLAECASARAAGGPRAGLDRDLVKRTGAAPV
jgi:5'-nucleotidase